MAERNLLESALLENGNDTCADCGKKGPDWASVNLGIYVCIDCASIHRRLGATISRIKSIKLDQWTAEMTEVFPNNASLGNITLVLMLFSQAMLNVGNLKAKKEFEAKVPSIWTRPTPDASLYVPPPINPSLMHLKLLHCILV
jgi:hypothetical protein